MLTKLYDIIEKIPLPPPNKKKLSLRATKNLYKPIGFSKISKPAIVIFHKAFE